MAESQYNDPEQMRHFQDLWDEACKGLQNEPIHPIPRQPVPEVDASELLRERRESASQGEMDFRDMLLVSENIDKIFGEASDDAKDTAEKAGNAPNPIHPWTRGEDQELKVTPNFSDGDALRELNDLKIKIEGLERELHGAEVIGTKKEENSVQKQIDSIRSKIDELSQQLAPGFYHERD